MGSIWTNITGNRTHYALVAVPHQIAHTGVQDHVDDGCQDDQQDGKE